MDRLARRPARIDSATGGDRRPLVVTADPDTGASIARLCAAASVTPDVVPPSDIDGVRSAWRTAACVVVGADCAEALAATGLGRRPAVVLTGGDPGNADTWRRAVAIGAEEVVTAADQSRLVRWLAESVEGSTTRSVAVGVVGARGGAGVSTLSAALSVRAAALQHQVVLVDADPLGGGLDLLLGCEDEDGLRWADVAATRGQVSAEALRAALPRGHDVSVLSWDRTPTPAAAPHAVHQIMAAARRGSDVVVVDLPRRLDGLAREALLACDVAILLCPADVRAAAGAGQLLPSLRSLCGDIRLVVRTGAATDVTADGLADHLGLPLLGVWPTRRGLERSVDEGLGPVPRGRLARACDALLSSLLAATEGSAAAANRRSPSFVRSAAS